jgi:hypothetical protein
MLFLSNVTNIVEAINNNRSFLFQAKKMKNELNDSEAKKAFFLITLKVFKYS